MIAVFDRIQLKQKELFEWLMQPCRENQSGLERVAHRVSRISYAIVRDLTQGSLTLHAMSLVFTSILSIVPLLALSFSLLRYFNVQNRFLPMIEHFLLPMGEKGQEIHQAIMQFVDNVKVGVLGAVGLLLLLYTVLSLVQKIEFAFNRIWFVANTRSISRRLSNYLSMIFVGPILVVAAISLTSGLFESALIKQLSLVEPFGVFFTIATDLMPSIVLIAAFAFFYVLVPNTRVRASNAFVGAIVAGIIWQIAGQAFTAFVVSSARYDVIYSGFAVGIVALLWLYASWLILLLGSSIAFYLQNDNYITRVLNVKGSPVEIEQLALRIMIDVADAQERRSSPIKQDALESIRGVPGVLVREVVETLLKGKLIIDAGKDGDCFVLARSSDLISVADILSLARQKHSRHLADIPEGVRTIAKDLNQFIETQYSEKTLRDLIST
ncbi:hypothetical protein A3765_05515 [Oleiphilus sp. HI0130]|nr:hypothetical protein A3758_09230 [Oleiphilus sp. HI0118]KZZ65800.1 hypothetical protein A3765_05515 [Oleiphilus sp. HI0130]